MGVRLTTEIFVERANIKHNYKFLYPDPYIKSSLKIRIQCITHGIFEQEAGSHLLGYGCPQCAIDARSVLYRKSMSVFVEEANIIHNNKYEYVGEYINSYTKITIICPIHGYFEQTPSHHLHCENGCPKCAGKVLLTNDEWLERAHQIHGNNYNYPEVYVNARTQIQIECPKHGIFIQYADSHIRGFGCASCSLTHVSKPEIAWLDFLKIPQDLRQKTIKIKGIWKKVDAYDHNNNTIYEFNGDYWHGNPAVFKPEDLNKVSKKTFGELHQKTIEKENFMKNAGYTIISIWESDWNKIVKSH